MNQSMSTRTLLLALFFLIASPLLAQLQPVTMRQIQSLLDEKASRTPVQRKISSQLLQASRELNGIKMTAGIDLDPVSVNADKNGILKVDITATVTNELINKLKSIGALIIFASPPYHSIRAQINLNRVETVAGYPEVSFIKPAVEAVTIGTNRPVNRLSTATGTDGFNPHKISFAERAARVTDAIKKYMQSPGANQASEALAGTVTSQGDRTHRADDARNRYGYAGQGIRIGVISDSYNATGEAPDDIATGNLPGPGNPLGNTAPVTVLVDDPAGGDEGRAMLQIVHDLAPKAQLFFATADISEASFATNIIALRNAPYNCDIIIDDIGYYDEPVFQDGIVAQAVNTVTASGALYFSATGNEGSVAKNTAGVWEGDFNDTGSPVFTGSLKAGTIHNFGTVASPLNGDIITETGNLYDLKWADPMGKSTNDYDLFLVSAAGVVKASSTNIQSGTQDPFEGFSAITLVAGDRLVVFKAAAAQKLAFNLNTNRGTLSVATTGQTYGHSAAASAFSVAATPAAQPFDVGYPTGPYPNAFTTANKVELFTSDGPRRIFFNADGTPITPGNFLFATGGGNVRNKPDITAADGVSTTLDPTSGLNPFYGTSAAAPHAGAIAALLKSANPALTSAQIRTILTTTALDIESTGWDNVSGSGIVQAFQAMQAVNPTPLATLTLGAVTVTEGSFSNGNGFLDPGELGTLVVQLTNGSLAPTTGVTATISTNTPGVTILKSTASYGNIGIGASASNAITPFSIAINRSVACGTVLNFYVTVSFIGGVSPQTFQFSLILGTTRGANVSSKLGTTPPVSVDYTSATGFQTGRISRDGVASSCGLRKTVTLTATTGARAYDAYTFTNQSPTSSCVTVSFNSTSGIDIFTAAYNDSGYVPASPLLHYLGDAGLSNTSQSFAINVAAGKKFTVVVHAVTPGADSGAAYTLSVLYSICSSGPSCNPVVITTPAIASGATGTPYTQSFTATGGSGSGVFSFAVKGNLPAGLSFSGSTLRGTPTQAGSFPISVIAIDPAGCTSDTNTYTLVIAGNPPASVAATYGTPQSAYPGKAFAQGLQATVKDAGGNPLPGVKVIFTAPATGASGLFAGGSPADTVVTNSNGVAGSTTITANAVTGSYTVTANVNGLPPASFQLTNFCPPTVVVTSDADSGAGTLREALSLTCPGTIITFDQGVSYIRLTSGELPINQGVTINGPGADKLTISGSNLSRIFNITAGATSTVNISGLTITDGTPQASSLYGGGGILITSGIVNITGCAIANSDASLTYYGEGGAIDNEGGTVSIDRSSIYNNTSYVDGGGITNYLGAMRVTNSTITGNTAGALGAGGAIYMFASVTLVNCTIYGNTASFGGNLYKDGGTFSFRNTIIAGGKLVGSGGSGPDIFGTAIASADFNLIESTAGATITGVTAHNRTGVKPKLFPLRSYGGTTPVMIPQSNSAVINAGDSVLTAGLDQRNYARVIGSRADIGAVEVNYVYLITRGSPQSTLVNTSFAQTLQARIAESGNFIAGDSLFFSAPANGASGRFPAQSLTAVALTDAAGYATSPVFTANATAGQYTVTCSVGPAYPALGFQLTNTSGGAAVAAAPAAPGATTATARNCQVQVQWQTSQEQNTREFTVEYSATGSKYIDLATVKAKGSSSTTQTYSYTHNAPAGGTVYYRIRQTDATGRSTIGDVVTVTNSCGTSSITTYPNPVTDRLIVQAEGTARQLMSIYDVLGRPMTQVYITGGRNEINTRGWAKGMYTVTIVQNGRITYTGKIIKE